MKLSHLLLYCCFSSTRTFLQKEQSIGTTVLKDSQAAIQEVLKCAKSIHILGAGINSERPAHRAIGDLENSGWRLVPIHPTDAGGSILGRPIRSSIESGIIPEIVVLFLSPQRAKSMIRSLMVRFTLSQMPLLWFQPGSEDEEVLEMLNDANITHIAGECIVRFVQRHNLKAVQPCEVNPWYRQISSPSGDGCSIWSQHTRATDIEPPKTLEWCGDLEDLEKSDHTIARYIRSLNFEGESLTETAERLARSEP